MSANQIAKTKASEVLEQTFNKANGIFVTDFRGLTVEEMTKLRFELKKAGTDYKIVKNRLALRALKTKNWENADKHFDNMTAVALSFGDVSASAKALTKFSKDNEKLKIRAGMVEGKVVSLEQVKALASLPSRNELLAKLLGTLVAVPTGWVRVLNGVPSKWVYLLQAIKNKKEQG